MPKRRVSRLSRMKNRQRRCLTSGLPCLVEDLGRIELQNCGIVAYSELDVVKQMFADGRRLLFFRRMEAWVLSAGYGAGHYDQSVEFLRSKLSSTSNCCLHVDSNAAVVSC